MGGGAGEGPGWVMARDKLADIEERMSRSLRESLGELYLLQREEAGRLEAVRKRASDLAYELKDLAGAIDRAVKDYERSRKVLVESAILGEAEDEKLYYDRASASMQIRGSLEERRRLLSAQRTELLEEERRLERLVAKSESMGTRLRMVLNLMSLPEGFAKDDSFELRDAETLRAAFQLAEREASAFARDLHDGPTQTFSAVGLTLELGQEYLNREDYEKTATEIDRALEQTRGGLNEIRAFLFSLSPTGIEEGFETPLRRLASQIRQTWGCEMSFVLNGELGEVSGTVRLGAFKALHQAALNAARHGATEVEVAVGCSRKVLRVRVMDNGKGFDVEYEKKAAKERGSYGLSNMEAHVKMLGGSFSVSSAPPGGSVVSFSIPLLVD
jgi:two-component system sensor histidine kinase DegS